MKRLIYLPVILMIGFILIGCSGMMVEQRNAESELRSSGGNKPFFEDSFEEARKKGLAIDRY